MGSKSVENSEEICDINGVNHCSVNVGDTSSSFKSKARDSLQHTTGDTSNLLSANSSHDYLSENAESRGPLRVSSTAADLEGLQMLPNKKSDSKVVAHDDNISYLSRTNDTNLAFNRKNVDQKNLACSVASVDSVGPEEIGKPRNPVLSEMPSQDAGACGGASKEKLPEISGLKDSSLTKQTNGDGQDAKHEALKSSGHAEQDPKSRELGEVSNTQPLQSVPGDNSDESEIVEHDVKVCDICGDAGREDLLAFCSRCSDGAEHTYCMRKMLRKVPKGDWLCEECKAEEIDNQKQGTNVEGKRMKKATFGTRFSNKRRGENIEVAPSAKRQTLETRVSSPKPSSPKRTAVLSRESSFKSIDKERLKPAYQSSQSNDISETARSPSAGPRFQPAKGPLLKSNSFNTFTKPKVKLVDNIAPQKQKGSKDHTSLDMKERAARMMGKSMSFRSTNSVRSNVSEAKVKKLDPVQDLKGMKQAKEQNPIERKNLSKLERPLSLTKSSMIVSTPKIDQASRGETSLHNHREQKVMPSDGKLTTSCKAISSLTRKGVESQTAPVGASAMSGMGSSASEKTSNQVISNDELEKLPADVDGKLEDVPQSWEATNEVDKTRESSVPETCVADVSAPASYREEKPRSSRLKDAINAAMLIKPEIYRKKTVADQSDELSTPNMELSSDVASQDQPFTPNILINNICTEGPNDGQPIPGASSDSHENIAFNDVKPLTVQPMAPFLGKPTMKDLPHNSSTAMSLLKTTAIPEFEYTWQGSFEVQRGGNILDLFGGIQAHLSTCASPKVLEVVNKFPHKFPLKEVSRFSVWPAQFHQSGVKEDNIALYFFAKDLESYENYKILLDAMITNDLALKGKLGGVELLILPSNQLPQKSQRWNMLYFLWGVFRETKLQYLDTTKKIDVPDLSDVPMDIDTPTVMTLPNNLRIPEAPDPVVPTVSKDLERKDYHSAEMCLDSKETFVRQDSGVESKYTTNKQEIRLAESRLETSGGVGVETVVDRKNGDGIPGAGVEELILEKGNMDRDELKQERELKRDDGSKETQAVFVGDLTTRDNSCRSYERKRPHIDLSETAASPTSSQEMPWNLLNSTQRDGDTDSKRPKIDPSGLHASSSSLPVCYSSVVETGCLEDCGEKVIPEDLGTTEMRFFPVDSTNVQDFRMDNAVPWRNYSSGSDDKSDGFPSLELALRAETKPQNKGNLPFFVNERDNQDRPLDKISDEKEDDVSASLSLSLSFPFPDKESPPVRPEQVLPERHHVNTSLLLFGSFPEK